MNCPRCSGFMISQTFEDLRDDTGQMHFKGYRCMICGEIIDAQIASNREHRPHLQARNRKLMSY